MWSKEIFRDVWMTIGIGEICFWSIPNALRVLLSHASKRVVRNSATESFNFNFNMSPLTAERFYQQNIVKWIIFSRWHPKLRLQYKPTCPFRTLQTERSGRIILPKSL